jgi:uncharacterized SAM-binding protein YcdF (DUF218 family)
MRFLLRFLFMCVLLWAAGLAVFALTTPQAPLAIEVRTDAIVVLTGGKGRVERGFRVLAADAAPLLFISGVGQDVTLQEMMQAHTNVKTRDAIHASGRTVILGHSASTTQTNAQEVAAFVKLRPVTSIRLVTSYYHMRRSLLEFTQALPQVTLYADPVMVADANAEVWWRDPDARRLLLSEYHKTIAVYLRSRLS